MAKFRGLSNRSMSLPMLVLLLLAVRHRRKLQASTIKAGCLRLERRRGSVFCSAEPGLNDSKRHDHNSRTGFHRLSGH